MEFYFCYITKFYLRVFMEFLLFRIQKSWDRWTNDVDKSCSLLHFIQRIIQKMLSIFCKTLTFKTT